MESDSMNPKATLLGSGVHQTRILCAAVLPIHHLLPQLQA